MPMQRPVTINESTMIELFRRGAWEVAQMRFDILTLDHKLSQLGIDSVAMLEMVGFFEQELGIQIADNELEGVTTLNDLLHLVRSQLGNQR